MGDDNTPRHVLQLFRGRDDMYDIIPIKGESFQVNGEHVLCVKFTNLACVFSRTDGYYSEHPAYRVSWYEYNTIKTDPPVHRSKMFHNREEAEEYRRNLNTERLIRYGDVLDIKVVDLMKWKPWWLNKGNITLYKSEAIAFDEKEVKLDPYLLGHWLGDGHSRCAMFTTMDQEIVEYYRNTLTDLEIVVRPDTGSKARSYGIKGTEYRKNWFLKALQEYAYS